MDCASDQFPQGLAARIDEVLRPAGQIVDHVAVRIESKLLVEGREDVAEFHRAIHAFAGIPARRPDDLAEIGRAHV